MALGNVLPLNDEVMRLLGFDDETEPAVNLRIDDEIKDEQVPTERL